MSVRQLLRRLRTPPAELDEERLREFCSRHPDAMAIGELRARTEATVVGEVASIRIVPRAGMAWLEVTITDGSDRVVAMWTGRRAIPGVDPGRRLVIAGRPAAVAGSGGRLRFLNPTYELL
jgi:hypothetical protein